MPIRSAMPCEFAERKARDAVERRRKRLRLEQAARSRHTVERAAHRGEQSAGRAALRGEQRRERPRVGEELAPSGGVEGTADLVGASPRRGPRRLPHVRAPRERAARDVARIVPRRRHPLAWRHGLKSNSALVMS